MIPDRPDPHDDPVVVSLSEIAARQLASLEDTADLSGLGTTLVVGLCERRIVAPAARDDAGVLYFDHRTVFQLRRIGRIRDEFGFDTSALEVVLALLERIDHLESELRALRERI